MQFLWQSPVIALLWRLFWMPGVIIANNAHVKNAENNVKRDAMRERTAVINVIMTKINIMIIAATAEILNNTDADFTCP